MRSQMSFIVVSCMDWVVVSLDWRNREMNALLIELLLMESAERMILHRLIHVFLVNVHPES